MATIKFFTKGKNNPSTIYLRFTHGRKFDFTKSTSLLINPNYWNNKNGSIREVAEFENKLLLKNKLNDLSTKIINTFNNDYSNGKLINSIWLENNIDAFFDQKKETDLNIFTSYAENYIYNLDFKTEVTHTTKLRYKNLVVRVKEYETIKNKVLKLTDIDLKFYRDFLTYLNKTRKLSLNTIGKHISIIKTICIDAKNNDYKISNDISKSDFRVTKEKTIFTTFTETEVDEIFYHTFKDKPYLQNAKNWLIIGVWTGARASDLLNFTSKNINNGFLEYTSQKTKQKIILPIHWQVQSIIDELNSFPHKISTQKYNDYIKKVCEELKFNDLILGRKLKNISTDKKNPIWRKNTNTYKKWELVSTHIGRRTFATLHYGKLPTPIIMSATGHTTEKMLLNYIGKTSKDNADLLQEFWNTEKLKRDKKTILQIAK